MKFLSLTRLPDRVLLRKFKALLAQDCGTTAELLAYIAEIDRRKLFLPAAYPSMYQYCVHEFHMSEDVAFKRIRAARAARKFPVILSMIADGQVHLSAVVVIAPHLRRDTVDELLAAATHSTKAALERMVAERFPREDVPTVIQEIGAFVGHAEPPSTEAINIQLAPGPVDRSIEPASSMQLAPGPVHQNVPLPLRAKIAPLSADGFLLQVTLKRNTHELMRYVQALFGHTVPPGDIDKLFELCLLEMAQKLERRKFAKCVRTRPRRGTPSGRYVPAETRRTVWQRDGGRCTFESESGKRCPACSSLEFDHIEPVARGGESTAANLRLRCRAHNQYTAECEFGVGFMESKRKEAKSRTRKTHAKVAVKALARVTVPLELTPEQVEARRRGEEAIPWLRQFGLEADEAKHEATSPAG